MENIKLVVIGDGAVGKSCLLITYCTNAFPSEYTPTVFDNYSMNILVANMPYNVSFWDTAGQEDYDRLRPLSYPESDVFLICFAVDNLDSLENVQEKWVVEANHYCPDTPWILVGLKSDLRSSGRTCVAVSQAQAVAKRLGAIAYCEASSLQYTGLNKVFETAFAAFAQHSRSKKSRSRISFFSGKPQNRLDFESFVPPPPVMPPAGRAPWIYIDSSTFANDMKHLLHNSSFNADVSFQLSDGKPCFAHRSILSCGSSIFRRFLAGSSVITSFSTYCPVACQGDHDSDGRLIVNVRNDVDASAFRLYLDFLYTGSCALSAKDDVTIQACIHVAEAFQHNFMKAACENVLKGEEDLNPSIGTFLNDELGASAKSLLFQHPLFSDLRFILDDGKIITAHRAIVAARSPVLAAMLSHKFQEATQADVMIHEIDSDVFEVVLEYLYTDHAPLEDLDPMSVLVVADLYQLSRLTTLCELYLTKVVERATKNRIRRADINLCGMLDEADQYHAKQLVGFLLHFISTNYQAMSQREEFALLSPAFRQHVEQHQWPPLSYLNAIQEYESKYNTNESSKQDKCILM